MEKDNYFLRGELMEISKVHKRKDGVKLVTIPKKSQIEGGEYVGIVKLNEEEKEHAEE